jgi:hypothetical protein
MNQPARFIPYNAQEHDNDMRALAISHMGTGIGNPSQWVVTALHEAFQRGFALGFTSAQQMMASPPTPPPRFRIALPDSQVIDMPSKDKP